MDNTIIIIAAAIGGLGPTVAAIVNIFMTRWAGNKAQQGAAEAARLLVSSKADTDSRLAELKASADKNMAVTEGTHTLVNSQNSRLVRLLAQVSRRVANDNPNDLAAQDAAMRAERDAAVLPPDM